VGYSALSTCENIWLQGLFYNSVHLLLWFGGINVLAMVTKTMDLHVLLYFIETTTMLASFDL